MILLYGLVIYADTEIGMYEAAEEMIRFDEKMNRAIAEHNQLNKEDEDEMRLNAMVEDFEEIEGGYLLIRNISDSNNSKIEVKLNNGMLTIITTIIEQEGISSESISGLETTLSSSSLSLPIPNDADENRMNKTYKNGVLKIKFPKKSEQQ
jgi:HSP20 family molecular chaperone IbpA